MTLDESKKGIFQYTLCMFIFSVFLLIMNIFFFWDAPSKIPTSNEEQEEDLENNNLVTTTQNDSENDLTSEKEKGTIQKIKSYIVRLSGEFLYCLKEPKCRSIVIIFTLVKGSFMALNSVMVIALTNLDYTKLVGSIVITLSLLCGLSFSMLYTRTIGKNKNQKFPLSVLICMSLFFLSLSIITLYKQEIYLFMISFVISGMLLYSFIPMMLEIATRLSLPFNKSSLNSFLMLLAQLFAVLIQIVAGFLFKSSQGTFAVLVLVAVIYVINFWVLRFSENK